MLEPAWLKYRSQVTGQVTGHRSRSQVTGHRSQVTRKNTCKFAGVRIWLVSVYFVLF